MLKNLPPPPSLKKLIGPSFILLGLGLGSGEIILWPLLTSIYGLGLVWGMVIGITIQFFINMEIERYALIYGESVFVGFKKLLRWLPIWFIFSTFISFGWPGIGLAGATAISKVTGLNSPEIIATIIFILIGLILSFGKSIYKTTESLQKILIMVGVPFIIVLTLYLSNSQDLVALAQGLIGQGNNYLFLPVGISLGTFLGALAYSGAGGNLNLAQSFYIRDKGYGMGHFADKITNIRSTKNISLSGTTFPLTTQNLANFKKWWRLINQEHLIVFWFLGLLTMLTLGLLAFVTAGKSSNNQEGLNFLFNQASTISQKTLPIIGSTFLGLTGLMLLSTQLGVLDSTSRIISENTHLLKKKPGNLSKTYFLALWLQIVFGIAVFSLGFNQPQQLIILGATLNAFAMFIYTGILLYLNNFRLPQPLRPHPIRNLILISSFIFLGYFCLQTLLSYI
ncbi:Nramp family divalent metal transporter [Patescibacteria group bacterium]|nr:Nramp family divalent metal transporter [Patescibacteria group bacterium]